MRGAQTSSQCASESFEVEDEEEAEVETIIHE